MNTKSSPLNITIPTPALQPAESNVTFQAQYLHHLNSDRITTPIKQVNSIDWNRFLCVIPWRQNVSQLFESPEQLYPTFHGYATIVHRFQMFLSLLQHHPPWKSPQELRIGSLISLLPHAAASKDSQRNWFMVWQTDGLHDCLGQ